MCLEKSSLAIHPYRGTSELSLAGVSGMWKAARYTQGLWEGLQSWPVLSNERTCAGEKLWDVRNVEDISLKSIQKHMAQNTVDLLNVRCVGKPLIIPTYFIPRKDTLERNLVIV